MTAKKFNLVLVIVYAGFMVLLLFFAFVMTGKI